MIRFDKEWWRCFSPTTPTLTVSDNFDWQWNDAFLLLYPTLTTSIDNEMMLFSYHTYSDNFDWQWNDAFLLPHSILTTSIDKEMMILSYHILLRQLRYRQRDDAFISLTTFYSDNYFSSAFIFSTFPSFIITSPTVLFLFFPPTVRTRNDCLYWSWTCILKLFLTIIGIFFLLSKRLLGRSKKKEGMKQDSKGSEVASLG